MVKEIKRVVESQATNMLSDSLGLLALLSMLLMVLNAPFLF